MSRSLVSKCIRTYSYVITTKIMDKLVHFPQSVQEIEILHDDLQKVKDYPGAFGIVDGSLIPISAVPHEIEHGHVSRKSFHAINAQFSCDVRMRFLSVNARYAGSTHDALIWRASLVNTCLRQMYGEMSADWSYYLLGDNGYPLQPWILKPYDNPETPSEKLYNKKHKQLRCLIEQAIGLLKARFRCLSSERKLRYDPEMCGYIIYSCTVLHNFLISKNYPIDSIDPIFEEGMNGLDDLDDPQNLDIPLGELEVGAEMRYNVAQYFSDM